MATYTVTKSTLQGSLIIPSSKSHTLRAILFGMLSRGKSTIYNYLPSPDAIAMIQACRQLGAEINIDKNNLEIIGTGTSLKAPRSAIDAGNSGIVLRFMTAIAALSSHQTIITGDHSVQSNRPMTPLIQGLSQLGAKATSMRGDGYAPISVRGPLPQGSADIQGEDSQPISALLIAAAFAQGPIDIKVRNAGEKPWVAMTLSWFDRLGIPYKQQDFSHYQLFGQAQCNGFSYTVPGDLSTVAFPIAAALLTKSELTIQNVDMADCQGDKELIHLLKKMGAKIDIDAPSHSLHISTSPEPLIGTTIDINDYIDAIAVLAVISCFALGVTHLKNASNARHKECDRIRCLTLELKKMGANIIEEEDGLTIYQSQLHGASLDSHNDHRLAMALTIAALAADGPSTINHIECISKTYPGFLEDFNALGAKIIVL